MTSSDFFCSKCGRSITADSSFCPGCGTPTTAIAPAAHHIVSPSLMAKPTPLPAIVAATAAPPPAGNEWSAASSTPAGGWWGRRRLRTKVALIGGGVLIALSAISAIAAPQGEPVVALASQTANPTARATPRATPQPTVRPTPRPTPVPTVAPTPVPELTWNEMMVAAENVSYDELFRHSADHIGDLVYFKGQVIQVLGETGNFEMRISVTPGSYGFWDDPVYVLYVGDERFLDDDVVEFIGISTDLLTYESVLGGDITIPSVMSSYMRLSS